MKKLATVLFSSSVLFFAFTPILFAASGGSNSSTDAIQTVSTITSGSIPFVVGNKLVGNNAQLFWNVASNTLSIGGTTTPAAKLSVKGSGTTPLINFASSTGSSMFFINALGNVGINTLFPEEKLDVTGNARFIGALQANSFKVLATTTIGTLLGIGNTSPLSALDVSGAMYSRLVTVNSSNIDWNAGNVQTLTLNSNQALTFTNGHSGGEYTLILKQNSAGNKAVTWPGSVLWSNATTPTITDTPNAIDLVRFVYDGTNYLASFSPNYATPAAPSIAFGNWVDGGTTSDNSKSWSMITSGSNEFITIACFEANNSAMNATVDGNSATVIASQQQATTDPNLMYLFYYLGTNPGSHVISCSSVDAGGILEANSAFYSGVRQSGQPDNYTTSQSDAVISKTTSLNTAANNSWTILLARWQGNPISAGTGSTKRGATDSVGITYFDSNGPISPNGETSMTIEDSGSHNVGTIMVSFAPAP